MPAEGRRPTFIVLKEGRRGDLLNQRFDPFVYALHDKVWRGDFV